MPVSRLVVFDFDGTMTDAEAEAGPFKAGYLADLAALSDRSLDEVQSFALATEAEIAADPGAYGWLFGGRIVAPALVDPYLRMMPVARKLLTDAGRFQAEPDRTRLLDDILYKYNYARTLTVFREGAAELLGSLSPDGDLYACIVTNSHTEPVQNKVRALGQSGPDAGGLDWLVARVFGRARKYQVDDSFDLVPEALQLPGLARPVLLRRRAYYETLDGLRQQLALDWGQIAVVGDIFELDLALPISLGAQVALLKNAYTPAYEVAWLDAHPRGAVLDSLMKVSDWLRG